MTSVFVKMSFSLRRQLEMTFIHNFFSFLSCRRCADFPFLLSSFFLFHFYVSRHFIASHSSFIVSRRWRRRSLQSEMFGHNSKWLRSKCHRKRSEANEKVLSNNNNYSSNSEKKNNCENDDDRPLCRCSVTRPKQRIAFCVFVELKLACSHLSHLLLSRQLKMRIFLHWIIERNKTSGFNYDWFFLLLLLFLLLLGSREIAKSFNIFSMEFLRGILFTLNAIHECKKHFSMNKAFEKKERESNNIRFFKTEKFRLISETKYTKICERAKFQRPNFFFFILFLWVTRKLFRLLLKTKYVTKNERQRKKSPAKKIVIKTFVDNKSFKLYEIWQSVNWFALCAFLLLPSPTSI